MMLNRKTLSGGALVVLAILFVAVLLVVNTLFRGVRVDLTQNNLYSLSQGTKNILGSIDEPINLYLFYSDKATQDLPQLRTYYLRVREMLEELSARANGKLKLEVIDPLPFSEDEDRATALGLQAVPNGPGGGNIFFGLAGTNSTNGKSVIPFFQPDKEAFLEYDVAKLIHELSEVKKPVVGMVSSLPLTTGFDQATRQMREPWAVEQQLEQQFDVRQLNATTLKTIDPEIGTLVIVQPKALNDDAQYAIDQFVLRGGHLLAFVDPFSEADTAGDDPNNPQAALTADKSSDMPKLFKTWGVDYDPHKVVLDRQLALSISRGQGQQPVRHPAILGFKAANLSRDDVVTSGLDTITMSTAGYFELAKDAKTKLIPLIQSSPDASSTTADGMRFLADPNSLLDNYKVEGTRVLAARLSGKLSTAFPDRKDSGHLAESKEEAQIILVADTDILSDRLWVQIQQFLGQHIMNAFANNGDFAVNAVDNLSGSSDLISIRGRATSQRPFTKVESLKRSADERFRAKEQELQKELADTERRLTELQSGKTNDQAAILSPEQKAEIDKFAQRKVEIRKELRGVRAQLDAEIEALGTRLKIIDIILLPVLVTAAALLFALWRRQRRRGAKGGLV